MKSAPLLLAVFLILPGMVAAATVSIPAESDTTLHENAPTNSFGGGESLRVGRFTSGATRARALVFFDVAAAVPPGATILAARLRVQATDGPLLAGTSQVFEIRRVLRAWSEGTQSAAQGGAAAVNDATWSHRLYPNTPWAATGGGIGNDYAGAASSGVGIGAADVYRLESTALTVADAQAWLDFPESNYGWALISTNESATQTARTFAAREDSLRAPALEIEFTTATPGFAVTGIGLAGGQATLSWTGGQAPFQVFTKPDMLAAPWTPVGPRITSRAATVNAAGAQAFFGVVSEPTAEYDVVFNATWSAATHPPSLPAGAHWSGLVGGLHNHRVEFWRPGGNSSVGMQRMAELGSKTALLAEVNAAITAGTVNRTLSGAGIGGGAGSATLRFQVDRTHPLVTLVTMIAPSPDWFAGIRGLPLIEHGQWVQSKTVALIPWDTGTDSGPTFTSPNQVTTPRGVITRIVTPPLAPNGTAPAMGTFTFTLVRIAPAP